MKFIIFFIVVAVLSVTAYKWAQSQTGLMAKSIATIFGAPILMSIALAVLFPLFFGFNMWMILSIAPLLIPAVYMYRQHKEYKEELPEPKPKTN